MCEDLRAESIALELTLLREKLVLTNFQSVVVITGFSVVLDMWVLERFSYQPW